MQDQPSSQSKIEKNWDLIIIGSGAGGMSTAVVAAHQGLKVLVLEKAAVIGGTSAWSGGWLWVPGNPLAKAAGIHELEGAPKTYINSVLGYESQDPRIDHFLEKGPEMVEFFQSHTALKFIDGNRVPDFHEVPGALAGGRSVAAAPFDGKQLGAWIHQLRSPLSVLSLQGMGIASGQDLKHFFDATRSLKSAWYVTKRLSQHLWDLIRFRRGMQLVNGNALMAALLKSALDRKVEIQTSALVLALQTENERVTGLKAVIQGQTLSLTARCGVVIAAGGFPHDPQRQRELFPARAGHRHFSAAPKANTGDGLRLAESIGVTIQDSLVQAGAWAPVSVVPSADQSGIHFPHLIERAKPGIIAVTRQGRRFVSEAESYHDFMRALFDVTCEGEEPECWLIADHKAQRRWGLGWAKPFPFPLSPYVRSGYLKSGRTLTELAEQCGIDADTLSHTLKRFNADAEKGIDTEFHRGESPYNRVQGDPDHRPNPSLAPLHQGPFYAVKIQSGSLGTFAGIPTDTHARVLNANGQVTPGLYAVGNDMSSIFNGHYPSGGITLGPAMTFGYIAALHAASQSLS